MPASDRQEPIRLLPGSLQLLPPGDKAAPGSLELTNWRVDQDGVLRSRRGLESEASGFGGPFHTLFRVGNDRYGLTGSNLHVGPSMGTFLGGGFSGEPCTMLAARDLVWIMDRTKPSKSDGTVLRNWSIANPAAAPNVAAGGQLTQAFASFDSGEAWDVIANDGQTNKWITETVREQISAVGTVSVTDGSPTVTGVGTAFTPSMVGKNIAIYNGSESNYSVIASVASATSLDIIVPIVGSGSGLSYEITTDETTVTETRQFDAANKTAGTHSLRMVCSPGGVWTARLAGVTKDTRISGGMRGDDEFRFSFYASDPGNIEKLEVTLLSGTSGDRRAAWAEIPAAAISPARFAWQELKVFRGLALERGFFGDALYAEILAAHDAAFEAGDLVAAAALMARLTARQAELSALATRFSANDGFDWAAVNEIQIAVTLTDASDIHLDEAYFVGGVNASLVGAFSYAVSYTNIWGHETSIGPYSASVTLDKQPTTLSAIPVSPDPQVNFKHIYRIGGGVNEPLRVGTIANATTGWTDTISTAEQQRNRVTPNLEYDPAPAAWGAVRYGGRVLAWKNNRLYWSEEGRPWSFPGSDDDEEGNWIDVGDDGDDIVTITTRGNSAWIYKQRSIWRLTGDPDERDPEPTAAGFGALGMRGVAPAGSFDYFRASEGVFAFNGDRAEKVSGDVNPIFMGDYPQLATAVFRTPASQGTAANHTALGYRNGRLYVSYAEEGQTWPNRTLVLDAGSGRWYDHSGGFRCFFDEGQGSRLIGGRQDGSIVSLEQLLSDTGSAIPLVWRTAYLDQGLPEHLKRYAEIVIECQTATGGETGPATLTAVLLLDNGASSITLGTMSASTRTRFAFPVPAGAVWRGRNMALLVTGSTTTTVQIYAAHVYFQVEPRVACRYDSGVVELAGRLPAAVEAIGLDVETGAVGAIDWRLESDLPGGALALRSSGSVSLAGGRRSVLQLVTTPTEGRRVRFSYVRSSGECPQLFGVRLKVRSAGDLFEPGQPWVSDLRDLGELHLIGAVEVIADSNGSVAYEMRTDLPGAEMAVRDGVTFDVTGATRAAVRLLAPHACRAKLLQVSLTPQAGVQLRLHSVRVWARNFSRASGGGAWGWISLFSAPGGDAAVNGGKETWVELPVHE